MITYVYIPGLLAVWENSVLFSAKKMKVQQVVQKRDFHPIHRSVLNDGLGEWIPPKMSIS